MCILPKLFSYLTTLQVASPGIHLYNYSISHNKDKGNKMTTVTPDQTKPNESCGSLTSGRSQSLLPGLDYAISHRLEQEALFMIKRSQMSDICNPYRPILHLACQHDQIIVAESILERAKKLGILHTALTQHSKHKLTALCLAAEHSPTCLKALLALDEVNLLYPQIQRILADQATTLQAANKDMLIYHLNFLNFIHAEDYSAATKAIYCMEKRQRPWKIIHVYWNKLAPFIQHDSVSTKNMDNRKVAKNLLSELIRYGP